jgi:hypothetical protein
MQPAPVECREREILEGRARADLKVYILTVESLKEPMPQQQFENIYDNSEAARVFYEQSTKARFEGQSG